MSRGWGEQRRRGDGWFADIVLLAIIIVAIIGIRHAWRVDVEAMKPVPDGRVVNTAEQAKSPKLLAELRVNKERGFASLNEKPE